MSRAACKSAFEGFLILARCYLLILLLPLALLWWCLCSRAPVAGWSGLNSFHDGQQLSFSHDTGTWEDWICLDIKRRQWRPVSEPLAGHPPSKAGISYDVSYDNAESVGRSHLKQFNHAQQRLVRSVDLVLPAGSTLGLVADRHVIADGLDGLRWMDLDAFRFGTDTRVSARRLGKPIRSRSGRS